MARLSEAKRKIYESDAYKFLTAVMKKDAETLKDFNVSEVTTLSITLKEQTDAATTIITNDEKELARLERNLKAKKEAALQRKKAKEAVLKESKKNESQSVKEEPKRPVFITSLSKLKTVN